MNNNEFKARLLACLLFSFFRPHANLFALRSPSVFDKTKSLKKNKIIWLALMCFDFLISNQVILSHMDVGIISVFHLHNFGFRIEFQAHPYLQ